MSVRICHGMLFCHEEDLLNQYIHLKVLQNHFGNLFSIYFYVEHYTLWEKSLNTNTCTHRHTHRHTLLLFIFFFFQFCILMRKFYLEQSMWFSLSVFLNINHRTITIISTRSYCLRVASFYFYFIFDQMVLRSGYYPN